jgi:hypothetical protein
MKCQADIEFQPSDRVCLIATMAEPSSATVLSGWTKGEIIGLVTLFVAIPGMIVATIAIMKCMQAQENGRCIVCRLPMQVDLGPCGC